MSRKARASSSSYSLSAGDLPPPYSQERAGGPPRGEGAPRGPPGRDAERPRLLERRLVGAAGPEGVVDVHDRHDARQVRDLLADQLVGVPPPVHPLVVVPDEGPHEQEGPHRAGQAGTGY